MILSKVTTTFKMVYTSENTGARRRLTIYRPDCPPGYFTLGDYAQASDTDTPNYGVSLCIKEIGGNGYLYPPVGYVQVWNGIHTSGDNTGALWKPLPQGKDYVAMGYVAVGRYSPELPTNLVCVHKSAAFLASCGGSLWSDHGSRSHRTCSIWSVKPSLDYLNLGTFVATRGYRAPPTGEFWALRPDIIPLPVGVKLFASYARAGDMALMYRDYGTGAEDHVSVYNPVAPTGYMPLEHYAHPGYHISPLAKIASVKEEGRTGLCAHPLKFRRVD